MNRYRTNNCGELRSADTGAAARLSGWVDTIRDHGGLVFIDLRDHYGVTQVVLRDPAMVDGLGRETVVSVAGTVRMRDDETVNPKLSTGEIELFADSIEILSVSNRNLPFEIDTSTKTREDLRLRYRFLDLRNPELQANILLRARVQSYLRRTMEEMGFVEIQTPILTSSSPEGARDYLVPSRKHKGQFYALPQAPQIFKQLLMTAGFDKYFQIAPCFRDEDSRADRSPGEFYQLDFEMAFAEQEDVFAVAEKLLYGVFSEFADGREVSPMPFRRIPYAESMLRYGSDKPDLRNPLLIEDLSGFFADVDFAPFKGKPVRGITAPTSEQPRAFFDRMLEFAMGIGMLGLGYISVLEDGELRGPIVKFLTEEKRDFLISSLGLKTGDTLFFISDTAAIVDTFAGQIRSELGTRLGLIDEGRFELCFITDFPMFGLNDDGAIEFTHNPFSMPQGELDALENQDPLDILAYQYDIVCNGVELSSGAVRNHRPEVMIRAFEIAGYSAEEVERRFGALYGAFHYGAPPHAGMAPGIERIVMLLAEQENIREVVAFPMNSNAQDLLLSAPGDVSEEQLREIHIKIRD